MDSLRHLPALVQLRPYTACLRVCWGQFTRKEEQSRTKSTLKYFLPIGTVGINSELREIPPELLGLRGLQQAWPWSSDC